MTRTAATKLAGQTGALPPAKVKASKDEKDKLRAACDRLGCLSYSFFTKRKK
jgi:hypothetical protein